MPRKEVLKEKQTRGNKPALDWQRDVASIKLN